MSGIYRYAYALSSEGVIEASRHFVAMQDTQPLPHLVPLRPTLVQLRVFCGLEVLDVVRASGVRYSKIYRMEHGFPCYRADIERVLRLLSQHAHHVYHIEDIVGLHVLYV